MNYSTLDQRANEMIHAAGLRDRVFVYDGRDGFEAIVVGSPHSRHGIKSEDPKIMARDAVKWFIDWAHDAGVDDETIRESSKLWNDYATRTSVTVSGPAIRALLGVEEHTLHTSRTPESVAKAYGRMLVALDHFPSFGETVSAWTIVVKRMNVTYRFSIGRESETALRLVRESRSVSAEDPIIADDEAIIAS